MADVLVISGSPRKGDSYKIARLLEEKISRQKDFSFEYVFLHDLSLEYCRGCLTCMKRGEQACPIKDDLPDLTEKLMNAKGVIFVSPVYVHTVTALYKNFLDRTAYYLHRPRFHGRPAILVSTTEISGLSETLDAMALPVKAMGFDLVARLGVLAPFFKEPGTYRSRMEQKIDSAGEIFRRKLASQAMPKPGFSDLVFFNKIKTKIRMHRTRFPFDYNYWQERGWLEADYFYPCRISQAKKALAKAPVRLIKTVMRIKLGKELYQKAMNAG